MLSGKSSGSLTSVAKAAILIPPYGGSLVDLLVSPEEVDELRTYANGLPSLQMSERAICDLELLAVGAFSPLDRFMGEADLQGVQEGLRLARGPIFPVPVTLPVHPGPAIVLDHDIALRNMKNELLAVMTVEEAYAWDRDCLAHQVYGTLDPRHPLVAEMQQWGPLNISGRLRVLQVPQHYDFQDLRLMPSQVRARLAALGRPNVVACHTRSVVHRAQEESLRREVESVDGILLLQPAVGLTKPGNVDYYARIRAYRALAQRYYDPDRILLALLPLASRLAGPREVLWHALIHRNYGANYFIAEPADTSPGTDSQGRPFYAAETGGELVQRLAQELGIDILSYRELSYLPDEDRYEEAARLGPGTRTALLSSTQVYREYLSGGRGLPAWFTRPEIAEILSEAHPPRHRQGACIWFTGLSGAGKSTTAEILTTLLLEHGRQVTLLDGDVVRTHLSKGLGFSKEDRDTNILRIGFVASEIVRHGGVAVCAAISPYVAIRAQVRNMVGSDHFVEVFVDTPLAVCEQRDAKGMYAKARRGEIKGFTGIDDPYEPPPRPEITLDTVSRAAEENARLILDQLVARGFVRAGETESLYRGVRSDVGSAV